MKYIRLLAFALCFVPFASFAATNDFMVAAQLLAAARNGDIQQVEILINDGADVNFVDSTGLSVVCTALMNNDVRAAQILQMYGADASKCDRQIRKYNSQNKPERSGGLFSGLSSTHTLTLAAAGAAVVVGGLLLLTDVLDFSNDNHSSSGGGDRPSGGNPGDGSGGEPAVAKITLPYGPALPDAAAEAENYTKNLDLYSPATDGILKDNFELMTKTYDQNYLLMMHGYSPFARGYMGMRTLRRVGGAPASVAGINIKGIDVGGGRPTGVAIVTANGVNAAVKPAGMTSAEKGSLDDQLLAWTTISGDVVNNTPEITNLSSKYYNNKIVLGTEQATQITDAVTVEDETLLQYMDWSGFGTAVQNPLAGALDNRVAQVVGGATGGYASADFMGFVPNSQMAIFRTGAGRGMVKLTDADTPMTGTYNRAGNTFAVGDTLKLGDGETITISAVSGNAFTATGVAAANADGDDATDAETPVLPKFAGYIGADGLLYITGTAGGAIDMAFSLADGTLTQTKKLDDIDYYNYRALLQAGTWWAAIGDGATNGRSRMDVLANASVIAPLHQASADTVDAVLANPNDATFSALINKYYDRNKKDSADGTANDMPSTYAVTFFKSLGSIFSPLVIFSTGATDVTGGVSGSAATQTATFENAAPLVFSNLEHLFMSVVAVGMTGNGTAGATSVSGYSTSNKIAISRWTEKMGTEDTADDHRYVARTCGVAGRGTNAVDPWCFAAAGLTDELAVSSAAGAAAAVKAAFNNLTNKEVFTLLALTADGPYLGSMAAGAPIGTDALISHLKSMYELPGKYQFDVDNGVTDYLDAFKEVFGYGLINLERATTPGTSVYFYDGSKIVSAGGNAYWRAASNTAFRASSAFRARGATIRAPFYDLLESADGQLRMPRVWENEFSLGVSHRRGMYLGDLFGDLKTRDENNDIKIGEMSLSLTQSTRPYADNMGNVDDMRLGFSHGNLEFAARYQYRFTDGINAFAGMSNPVLSLTSNAVSTDFAYNRGAWTFGARAYSAAVTDRELLENDPTVTAQFTPARLGRAFGAEMSAGMRGERMAITASAGAMRETNTVLGAYTAGLLDMGGGDTTYVDMHGKYNLTDDIALSARATFARTVADAAGQNILGLSAIDSNAFAVGANIGNFEFTVSRPLAVYNGDMKYAYADYDVVETDAGKYDIVVKDAHIANLNLGAGHRETRLAGAWRHKFGEFTDGAMGFIYRINPNNTDEFGNESILMLKMTHRVGI